MDAWKYDMISPFSMIKVVAAVGSPVDGLESTCQIRERWKTYIDPPLREVDRSRTVEARFRLTFKPIDRVDSISVSTVQPHYARF